MILEIGRFLMLGNFIRIKEWTKNGLFYDHNHLELWLGRKIAITK